MFYKSDRHWTISQCISKHKSNSRRQKFIPLYLNSFQLTNWLHYSCTLDQVRQTIQTGFIAKMMSAIDKLLKLKALSKKTSDSDEGSTIDLITVTKSTKQSRPVNEEVEDKDTTAKPVDSSSEDEDEDNAQLMMKKVELKRRLHLMKMMKKWN